MARYLIYILEKYTILLNLPSRIALPKFPLVACVYTFFLFNHSFMICIILGFMGYASDVYELVWHHKIEDTDDDQLYYSHLYLDPQIRASSQFSV